MHRANNNGLSTFEPVDNLISDALPFGGLWYTTPDDAVDYAEFYSRSHDAVIRVYDKAGNVIETHEHAGTSRAVNPKRRFIRRWTTINFVKNANLRLQEPGPVW
jgi:hypothetical protein